VKRLGLSIFLSLGIQAILMGLGPTWFKFLPQPRPQLNLVTISLVTLQPKGDPKASRTEKPTGTIEKKAKSVEKKVPPPPKAVVKPVPAKPVVPKQAVKPVAPLPKPIPPQKKIASKQEAAAKPVIPPLKTIPRQTAKKRLKPEKKQIPKKIKPKKSLKKMTKKPPKAAPVKEVAKIKSIDTPKPVIKTENTPKKATDRPQEKAPSDSVKPTTQTKPQNTSGKEPASEDTPPKESVTVATKGDTSVSAGLIMAKPLYRKNPAPNYPRRARRKGYEGNVILEVLVDEKGNVMELKVFKTSGYKSLDKSALSSVRKWLFEPGTRNGKTAKMWVRVPIRFKLN
jgi:protein TonB